MWKISVVAGILFAIMAPAQAVAGRDSADAAIRAVPGITATKWVKNRSYWVSVDASGGDFVKLALGVCGVLRRHGVRDFVVVTVLDANYLRLDEFKQLAKKTCP